MENFIWNPYDYTSSSSAQLIWAKELLIKFNLNGNENILDIGCGDGKITAELSKHVPDGTVVGIDSSKEMIKYASSNFPKSGFPNLKFYNMDARTFILEEKFDFVFSNAALHWFRDHLAVLKSASKAMKKIIKSEKWEKYFEDFNFNYYFYDTKDYPNWLKKAGLQLISIKLAPKDMVQDGKDKLAGWIRTTWLPYTHCVPDDLREEFIFDIVDNYTTENPPDGNGKIHVAMVRLEVEAIKKMSIKNNFY
jgi:trans-aconitate methyltransferase